MTPDSQVTKIQYELVVLDMMGTTVIDNGRVHDVFCQVLRSRGGRVEALKPRIDEMMGMSKSEVFSALGHSGARDSFRDKMLSSFKGNPAQLLPGASDLAQFLDDLAVPVPISFNTGFGRRVAFMVLEQIGWMAREHLTITDMDVLKGRPKPYMIFRSMEKSDAANVRKVCVVGDNPMDLRAGISSGAGLVVAVKTGGRSADEFPGIKSIQLDASRENVVGSSGNNSGEFVDCCLIDDLGHLPALLRLPARSRALS